MLTLFLEIPCRWDAGEKVVKGRVGQEINAKLISIKECKI
jgi:hypothetical protein